jgi:hypothetical protein
MKIPRCHRVLIGLESAEEQAARERPHGWKVGVLDPGIGPKDYQWRIAGDDVLAYCCEEVDRNYLHNLALTLLRAGARIIAVFDQEGVCLFGHFPMTPEHGESQRAD